MSNETRTDCHRPSAIIVEDYLYVAVENVKIEGLGDCYYAKAQRELIRAHMARTGGTYSQHSHGGNCMVCGNAYAHYTILFHHSKTNTYVRMGQDCAQKVECCSAEAFRALTMLRDGVNTARAFRAGKAKAEQMLTDAGLAKAFEIFNANIDQAADEIRWNRVAARQGEHVRASSDEVTICDIVARLVKYGNVSDKQLNFLRSLVSRIERRPEIEAQRKAEADAAAPVPVLDERMTVSGVVLTLREDNGDFGHCIKMLVKCDAGYKLWGTRPSSMSGVQVGDKVTFCAKVTASAKDPKFGFFSRPTRAKIFPKAVAA